MKSNEIAVSFTTADSQTSAAGSQSKAVAGGFSAIPEIVLLSVKLEIKMAASTEHSYLVAMSSAIIAESYDYVQ